MSAALRPVARLIGTAGLIAAMAGAAGVTLPDHIDQDAVVGWLTDVAVESPTGQAGQTLQDLWDQSMADLAAAREEAGI
jgi:hypothetical protein